MMNPQCKQIKSLWERGRIEEAIELTLQIIDQLNEELRNEQSRKSDS